MVLVDGAFKPHGTWMESLTTQLAPTLPEGSGYYVGLQDDHAAPHRPQQPSLLVGLFWKGTEAITG